MQAGVGSDNPIDNGSLSCSLVHLLVQRLAGSPPGWPSVEWDAVVDSKLFFSSVWSFPRFFSARKILAFLFLVGDKNMASGSLLLQKKRLLLKILVSMFLHLVFFDEAEPQILGQCWLDLAQTGRDASELDGGLEQFFNFSVGVPCF